MAITAVSFVLMKIANISPARLRRRSSFVVRCWGLSLLLLTACGRPPANEHEATYFVFGTLVEVKLRGVDETAAYAAFGRLQTLFTGLHSEWHPWEPGALTYLNRAIAADEDFRAPPRLVDLLEKSVKMEKASCGRFNPAIGALIEAWGFHTSDYPVRTPPPDEATIERLLAARPRAADLRLGGRRINSANRAVQLDLSGIAKGAAVDLALAELRHLEVPAALVNAGGDLAAYRPVPDEPWRAAIRDPQGGLLAGLELEPGEALFTSGNYERYREDAAERRPHIIDPATGKPVAHLASASVLAGQGWRADAAATALMVAGPDGAWLPIARRMGIKEALIVREDGRLELTAAMRDRLLGDGWQKRVAAVYPDAPGTIPLCPAPPVQ